MAVLSHCCDSNDMRCVPLLQSVQCTTSQWWCQKRTSTMQQSQPPWFPVAHHETWTILRHPHMESSYGRSCALLPVVLIATAMTQTSDVAVSHGVSLYVDNT